MKKNVLIFLVAVFCLGIIQTKAQNTAITDDDTYTAHPSAMLDVKSTSKGVLIPRLTTTQRIALTTTATTGLLVFDSTLKRFFFYNGTIWLDLATPESQVWGLGVDNVYLYDPNMNLGVGSTSPNAKLEVKADASLGPNDPIFHVLNASGDTIFAVYDGGVKINLYDAPAVKASGSKGGFAVGGFDPSKGTATHEYLRITPDSVRVYVEDLPASKASGSKGGFAVGGFSPSKAGTDPYNLFVLNGDSANIFIGDSTAGFGISNIQGPSSSLVNLNSNNYFIGHESGLLTKGIFNSFYGYQSGKSNYHGSENIFLGYRSGFSNVEGCRNVFIGKASGRSNVDGNENIFIGSLSGNSNVNAMQNIFIGVEAGMKNTNGYQNIFLGYQSGFNNIGGTGEDGSVNTFLGMQSGYSNTSGLANTFVGHKSGYTNTTGKFNTYIGRYAGETATGDFNVFIGSEAGRYQVGSYKLCINATQNGVYEQPLIYGEFDNNRVVINGDATSNMNNRTFFVKGTSGGLSAWFNDSDERLKKDIITIPDALKKVMSLRGVNYYWKDSETYGAGLQMGFIAQEADKVIPEVVDKSNDHYSMSYASITALLVEAIKEQQKMIEDLKKQNDGLKAEISKIDVLQKQVDKMQELLDIKAEKK